jgi:4'-phosphopantetheinyl transferase
MERPKLEILLQFIEEEQGSQWLEAGLAMLPAERQAEVRQYLSPMDGLRSLTGMLLVCRLLKLHHSELANMERDEWQRPHLPGQPDFNISHCKGWVAAAAIEQGKVGLDIEAWQQMPLESFGRVFTAAEMAYIQGHAHFEQAFFRIWTRKEALIKADGRGMHLDLKGLDVLQDQVQIEGQTWQIKELDLPSGWSGAIAFSTGRASIRSFFYQAGQHSIWMDALPHNAKA